MPSFLLVLALVLALIPATAQAATVASGKCADNVSWKLDGSGLLTVTGTGDMYGNNQTDTEDGDLNPSIFTTVDDQPWKDYQGSIRSVQIGSGITRIAGGAFDSCANLESVSIPPYLRHLSRHADDGHRVCPQCLGLQGCQQR